MSKLFRLVKWGAIAYPIVRKFMAKRKNKSINNASGQR